jgi:TonB-dependent starch-binding outer membrane protein SusC
VGSVTEKNFNKGMLTTPDQLIQGKVPGVQIINNNGQPGGGATVKVRGNSALTGTGQPLYVIDEVPLDGRSLQAGNNPLNFINPDDIASIDILKDASATAIYGSRASYGVVIINTKKGHLGKTKLDVAFSVGTSSILKKIKVLNADQYREAIRYYGVSSSYDKRGHEDAQDGIFRNAFSRNYSIAGSGGNENGKYRFSIGLLNQDGIIINTNFKKYNADATANLKLLSDKKLGLDLNLISSQYIKEGSTLAAGDVPIVQTALQWNPTEPLRNSDGSLNMPPRGNTNPIAFSEFLRDNLKVTTILGSISPYYKFSDWLEYKVLFSINYSTGNSRSSVNQAIQYPGFPIGTATINDNELTTRQITQTLSFNKEISKGLSLNAVAGYENMKFKSKGFGLTAVGLDPANGGNGFGNFGLDYTNYIQYSRADNRLVSSYVDPKSELQSFFGRTIFNYLNKYLLTATFRADGSTKFGVNNKYGYFPSFAGAWNISNEKFFKVGFVNSLKMRGGWGKTGNQEFPPGSSQALYAFRDNGIVVQINNPNPDLKWQSDRQYNIGIDFSLFNNTISGTVDYFSKTTTNLLFPSPSVQPAPPGSSVRWLNLDGEIINKGWEVLINSSIVNQEKIGLDLSVNATFLRNNVSGLPTPIFTGNIGGAFIEIIQNGHPMNAFYTRKYLGLDKSGFSVYQDDGTTFYYLGDPNPKTLLGISSTFRYKKFLLTANMNGSLGQDIFNATLMNLLNVGGMDGGRNIALSVFQNPVKESFANPLQSPSSRFIQSGSYLRMSNLTVSYSIGDVGKALKGANIFITGQNLFIITKYAGFDPEVNFDPTITNGGVPSVVPSLGIDFARYPSARSIIFGIKFSLN